MKNFEVRDADASIELLLAKMGAGEEVILTEAGQPIARVVPIRARERVPDTKRGTLWVADDFDASLPEDLLRAFEGRS